jgi:hypothetical protein
VEWIHLAQDMEQWLALVNTVMNFRVLYKAKYYFLTSGTTINFSRTLFVGVRTDNSYLDPNVK